MIGRKYLKWILFLSILGVALSAYLVDVHYSQDAKVCDINPQFSCSGVSQNENADFFGIPIAVLGLFGYAFLLLLAIINFNSHKLKKILFKKIFSPDVLMAFSLFALLISLYLTYIEFFVIKLICVVCLVSQVDIIIITYFSHKYRKLRIKHEQ